MRLLAISIVILAGAVAAGAGVIAKSLPDARFRIELDNYGILLAVIGLVIFIYEWWTTRSTPRGK